MTSTSFTDLLKKKKKMQEIKKKKRFELSLIILSLVNYGNISAKSTSHAICTVSAFCMVKWNSKMKHAAEHIWQMVLFQSFYSTLHSRCITFECIKNK